MKLSALLKSEQVYPQKQLMCNRELASKQLNKIQNRIDLAAEKAARDASQVTLIGASKQQPSRLMREFLDAGLVDYGENYLQEGLTKQKELSDSAINWHFIGRIQSNKCSLIAQNFKWVHAVDRLKVAKALAKARSVEQQALNLLVQLNVDDENSKGGVSPEQAYQLCAEIMELETIRLRGFMLIPKPRQDFSKQRRPFAVARKTMQTINQRLGLKLDTLSMGMSNDLESAILEGSTMIRVGSDLFGPRTPAK